MYWRNKKITDLTEAEAQVIKTFREASGKSQTEALPLDDKETGLIHDLRAQQKLKAAKEWEPRSLDSYTTEEKCAKFDQLYKQALSHYKEVREKEFADEDAAHYMFEAVFDLLSKPGKDKQDRVWTHYNTFIG